MYLRAINQGNPRLILNINTITPEIRDINIAKLATLKFILYSWRKKIILISVTTVSTPTGFFKSIVVANIPNKITIIYKITEVIKIASRLLFALKPENE